MSKIFVLNLYGDIVNTSGSVVIRTVASSTDRLKLEKMMDEHVEKLNQEISEQFEPEEDDDGEFSETCGLFTVEGFDVTGAYYSIDEIDLV